MYKLNNKDFCLWRGESEVAVGLLVQVRHAAVTAEGPGKPLPFLEDRKPPVRLLQRL